MPPRRTCPTHPTAPGRTRSSAARPACRSSSPPTPTTGTAHPPSAASRTSSSSEGGTRLAGLKSGKYDLITNLPPQDVEQAPQPANRPGPGEPDHHPRRRRGHHRRPQRAPGAQPGGRQAGDRRPGLRRLRRRSIKGQLLSPSILGHNETLEPYAYDPEQAKQLIEDAGVAGETITLVGESSGRWLNDRELRRGGRQLLDRGRAHGRPPDVRVRRLPRRAVRPREPCGRDLRVELERHPRPVRQLDTYYQADGVGSSNTDAGARRPRRPGSVDARSRRAGGDLPGGGQDRLRRGILRLARQQRGPLRLSERLQWTPRVDSKLLVKEMSVTG